MLNEAISLPNNDNCCKLLTIKIFSKFQVILTKVKNVKFSDSIFILMG